MYVGGLGEGRGGLAKRVPNRVVEGGGGDSAVTVCTA